ncbi:MAG: Crp/Fnr family transcriptional regulator [Acidobacteria bacterium]|nr:Crp/Fnr family transcriptional regulator [Acidobacteriota bacterium]MBI3658834.1 Crp/Fnr family transcriptional regulator [Acidobacteriota bacterium]
MTSSQGNRDLESCATCKFRDHSIFFGLNGEQIKRLDTVLHINAYPKGAILCFEGDAPRGVHCLCSGKIKLTRSSGDGKTVIVKIASPGDILGAESIISGNRHEVTAEALEPCQVKFLRREEFLQLIKENGPACFRLAQKLSDELCKSYVQIRDMGCKVSTMARLTSLLLRLMSKYGESTSLGVRLNVKLRQEELAEMIGASRETTSRLLTKLKKQGIMQTKGRSMIILDKRALENQLFPY